MVSRYRVNKKYTLYIIYSIIIIFKMIYRFYEMLYEATPWMAKDQTELLKNIKTKPLVFPAHIHRSEQVKDLLKGMIRVNEEERMSWDDVFKHPLL